MRAIDPAKLGKLVGGIFGKKGGDAAPTEASKPAATAPVEPTKQAEPAKVEKPTPALTPAPDEPARPAAPDAAKVEASKAPLIFATPVPIDVPFEPVQSSVPPVKADASKAPDATAPKVTEVVPPLDLASLEVTDGAPVFTAPKVGTEKSAPATPDSTGEKAKPATTEEGPEHLKAPPGYKEGAAIWTSNGVEQKVEIKGSDFSKFNGEWYVGGDLILPDGSRQQGVGIKFSEIKYVDASGKVVEPEQAKPAADAAQAETKPAAAKVEEVTPTPAPAAKVEEVTPTPAPAAKVEADPAHPTEAPADATKTKADASVSGDATKDDAAAKPAAPEEAAKPAAPEEARATEKKEFDVPPELHEAFKKGTALFDTAFHAKETAIATNAEAELRAFASGEGRDLYSAITAYAKEGGDKSAKARAVRMVDRAYPEAAEGVKLLRTALKDGLMSPAAEDFVSWAKNQGVDQSSNIWDAANNPALKGSAADARALVRFGYSDMPSFSVPKGKEIAGSDGLSLLHSMTVNTPDAAALADFARFATSANGSVVGSAMVKAAGYLSDVFEKKEIETLVEKAYPREADIEKGRKLLEAVTKVPNDQNSKPQVDAFTEFAQSEHGAGLAQAMRAELPNYDNQKLSDLIDYAYQNDMHSIPKGRELDVAKGKELIFEMAKDPSRENIGNFETFAGSPEGARLGEVLKDAADTVARITGKTEIADRVARAYEPLQYAFEYGGPDHLKEAFARGTKLLDNVTKDGSGEAEMQQLQEWAKGEGKHLEPEMISAAHQLADYKQMQESAPVVDFIRKYLYHENDEPIVDTSRKAMPTILYARPESLDRINALINQAKLAAQPDIGIHSQEVLSKLLTDDVEAIARLKKEVADAADPVARKEKETALAQKQDDAMYTRNKLLEYANYKASEVQRTDGLLRMVQSEPVQDNVTIQALIHQSSAHEAVEAVIRDALANKPGIPADSGVKSAEFAGFTKLVQGSNWMNPDSIPSYKQNIVNFIEHHPEYRDAVIAAAPMIKSSIAVAAIDSALGTNFSESFPYFDGRTDKPLNVTLASPVEAAKVAEKPQVKLDLSGSTPDEIVGMLKDADPKTQFRLAKEILQNRSLGSLSPESLGQFADWMRAPLADGSNGMNGSMISHSARSVLMSDALGKQFSVETLQQYLAGKKMDVPQWLERYYEFNSGGDTSPIPDWMAKDMIRRWGQPENFASDHADLIKNVQDSLANSNFKGDALRPESENNRFAYLGNLVTTAPPEALPKLIELAAQDPRMVSDDIVKRMTDWSSSKEIRELMYNTLPQAKDPYTVSAMLRSMQDAATLHFQIKKASEAPKPRRDETDPDKIAAAKEAQKNFVPDDAKIKALQDRYDTARALAVAASAALMPPDAAAQVKVQRLVDDIVDEKIRLPRPAKPGQDENPKFKTPTPTNPWYPKAPKAEPPKGPGPGPDGGNPKPGDTNKGTGSEPADTKTPSPAPAGDQSGAGAKGPEKASSEDDNSKEARLARRVAKDRATILDLIGQNREIGVADLQKTLGGNIAQNMYKDTITGLIVDRLIEKDGGNYKLTAGGELQRTINQAGAEKPAETEAPKPRAISDFSIDELKAESKRLGEIVPADFKAEDQTRLLEVETELANKIEQARVVAEQQAAAEADRTARLAEAQRVAAEQLRAAEEQRAALEREAAEAKIAGQKAMDNSSIDFVALRKVHDSLDWYHGYSDDIRAYRAGKEAITEFTEKLSGLAAIDPVATKAFVATLSGPENKHYSNKSSQEFSEAVERGTARHKSVAEDATTVDFDALRTQLEAAPEWRRRNYSKDRAEAALESVQNAIKIDIDGTAKLVEALPETAKNETDPLADIRKVVKDGLAQKALKIETEQKIAAGTAVMSASSFDFADLHKQIANIDWSDASQVGPVAEKIGQATLTDPNAAQALLAVLALDGTPAEVQTAVSNAIKFGEADREVVPASATSVDFDALYKQITDLNWSPDLTTVTRSIDHQLGNLKVEAMIRSMEHATDINPVAAQALRERLSATAVASKSLRTPDVLSSETNKQRILQVLDTALAKPENVKILAPAVQETEEAKSGTGDVVAQGSQNGAVAEQAATVVGTAEPEAGVKAVHVAEPEPVVEPEHAAGPEVVAKSATAAEPEAVATEAQSGDIKADSHAQPGGRQEIGGAETEHPTAEIVAPPVTPAEAPNLAAPAPEKSEKQVNLRKTLKQCRFLIR